MHRKLLYIV